MALLKKKCVEDTRKVAVYIRKSKVTEKGKSIEIQIEKCIALACSRYNVNEDDVLVYIDEGKSGFYADRPQYVKMINDIEGNKIRAVICHKIDRISRRTIDLLTFVQQLERKGIDFISVSDNDIDTSTKTGKIMITLLSAIAEFERDIIAERITENLYELAKEGRWLGGECPLGYFSKKETVTVNNRKTTVNHLDPIEDEQIIVKRLYELFLQTNSYNATFEQLNKEGFKTKKGKAFTFQSVKTILRNPVYAVADADMQKYFPSFDVTVWADEEDFDGERGIMAYNKTEQIKEYDPTSPVLNPKYIHKRLNRDMKEWIVSVGKHKGIISGADWIRVQSLAADISQDYSARPREVTKSLLSGVVRCAKCGNPMYVKSESGRSNPDGSPRFRYVCDVKYRKKGDCKDSSNVKGYEIDNFVIEQVCNISASPKGSNTDLYDELLNTKKTLQLKTKESEREINILRKRLSQIETEKQNHKVSLRTAPENVKPDIYDDISNLNQERDEKQARLAALTEAAEAQDNQIADIEKAKQTIMDFPRLIKLVDYEGKQQLLRRVLECVIVKGDIVHIFLKGSEPSQSFTRETGRSDVCHTTIHSITQSIML